MRVKTTEAPVLRACLMLFDLMGIPAWRLNSGMLPNARGRPVRFGFPGCPDLMALLPGGRVLFCECKRPGGRPTELQRAFLGRALQAGAVAIVVDDVMTLRRALDRLEADPAARLGLDGREIA